MEVSPNNYNNRENYMALPETNHYSIEVTEDPEHQLLNCYGIQNKATGVFEYYDNLLPRTYQSMVQMEEHYVEMERLIRGEPTLRAVEPIKKDTSH